MTGHEHLDQAGTLSDDTQTFTVTTVQQPGGAWLVHTAQPTTPTGPTP